MFREARSNPLGMLQEFIGAVLHTCGLGETLWSARPSSALGLHIAERLKTARRLDTDLVLRQCFARKVLGAGVEAPLDEGGIESHEILHLRTVNSVVPCPLG